jgi:hypothetical protein
MVRPDLEHQDKEIMVMVDLPAEVLVVVAEVLMVQVLIQYQEQEVLAEQDFPHQFQVHQ